MSPTGCGDCVKEVRPTTCSRRIMRASGSSPAARDIGRRGRGSGTAHRVGYRDRQRNRTAVGGVGRGRGHTDLVSPGHRLRSRSILAIRHAGDQRAHRNPGKPTDGRRSRRPQQGNVRALSRSLVGVVEARAAAGRRTILVAMHSFRPFSKANRGRSRLVSCFTDKRNSRRSCWNCWGGGRCDGS